jgi:hypothetical protein
VRTGRKGVRYLSVLKMERRRIASETVSFEIERGRGLVFRVSRFRIFGRKLRHLKLPGSPFAKDGSVAATGVKAGGKRADESNGEGKNSGVLPKRSSARER